MAKRALAKIRSSARHDRGGGADGFAVDAQARRQFAQNAEHLARFFFLQAHQFVVQIDGFERLEKQRLAGGTRAVDHAGQLAALAGNHRHHKALVADGDVFFLQNAFVAVGAQKALERFLNAFLLFLDLAAQAMQMRAGAIEHRSIGLDFAFDFFQQRAEIADALRALRQAAEIVRPPHSETTRHRRRDRETRSDRRFRAARAPRLRCAVSGSSTVTSGSPLRLMPDRRALPGWLRSGCGAQIVDRFARFGQIALHCVRDRRKAQPSPVPPRPADCRCSAQRALEPAPIRARLHCSNSLQPFFRLLPASAGTLSR